jgi:membrane fusion protein (multidrug efflux system)
MAETENKPNGTSGRVKILLKIAFVFIAIGVTWGAWWHFYARYREVTDNAYVTGNIVNIEPQTPGVVVSVEADTGMLVQKGKTLFRLGKADATVALDKAKAELADTVRQTIVTRRKAPEAQAVVKLRETELARAQDDYKRRMGLLADNAISKEELDNSKNRLEQAKDSLKIAQMQLSTAISARGYGPVEEQPAIERAKARFVETYLAWRRVDIVAPVSGYVAKRNAQVGKLVNPGQPLMAIAPLDEIWVEGNFKEGQIATIRMGQKVQLTSDLYGGSVVFDGKVAGLGAGTGAVFALIPPQNATGNWIKIVQRVPVRITLDPAQIKARPLVLGLSMRAEVDITNQGGPTLAPAGTVTGSFKTDVYEKQIEGARELADEVIAKAKNGKGN